MNHGVQNRPQTSVSGDFIYVFIYFTGMKTAIARKASSTCSLSPLWEWGRGIIFADSDCLENPQQEAFFREAPRYTGKIRNNTSGQLEVIFKKDLSKFYVVELTHVICTQLEVIQLVSWKYGCICLGQNCCPALVDIS